MKKFEELSNPNSCMSKALPDEMTFVMLARDLAAPATIRAWVKERIKLKLNIKTDAKIIEALECAKIMEYQKRYGKV